MKHACIPSGSSSNVESWPRRGLRRGARFATLAGALAALALPSSAHAAKSRLSLDLDYAAGLDEPIVDPGVGGALRLGSKFDLILLSLTPEFGASYHAFGGPFDVKHYAGFVGGRLALGKVLEPGVFTHIGVGHISGDGISETAPKFDAGVTLDLTLLPLIDLGAHAGYNTLLIADENSFDWFNVGAHAAIAF